MKALCFQKCFPGCHASRADADEAQCNLQCKDVLVPYVGDIVPLLALSVRCCNCMAHRKGAEGIHCVKVKQFRTYTLVDLISGGNVRRDSLKGKAGQREMAYRFISTVIFRPSGALATSASQTQYALFPCFPAPPLRLSPPGSDGLHVSDNTATCFPDSLRVP